MTNEVIANLSDNLTTPCNALAFYKPDEPFSKSIYPESSGFAVRFQKARDGEISYVNKTKSPVD